MPKLRRILLIEDNPDDETLVREACRRANVPHELVVAHDADAAMQIVAGDDRPALVLLDLRLHGTPGLDVLRALRKDAASASIPVVVLSSSTDRDDLERAYRAGANSYLRKPLEFAALDDMLRLVLHYWLRVNEEAPAMGGAAP